MDIVIGMGDDLAELSVDGANDASRIDELIQQVTGLDCPAAVEVDGRVLPSSTPLAMAGLLSGSTISLALDATPQFADIGVELVQTAGPGAGTTRRVHPGRYMLGRSKHPNAAGLSTAPVHEAAVELSVGANGEARVRSVTASKPARLDGRELGCDDFVAWPAGTLVVDGRAFELQHGRKIGAEASRRRLAAMGTDGRAAFNRPPRPAVEPVDRPVEVPDGGKVVGEKRRFPLLAMLAPLPIAVGMALLLGSPRFMLFGLMSPMMAGANWVSDRRQRKRDLGESTRADAAAVAEFTATVQREHARERERRRLAHPHLAASMGLAAESNPQLWQRRPDDPDAFQIAIGLADQPWQPTLERTSDSLSSAETIVAEAGPLIAVPVVVDFLHTRGLGFVGSTDFNDAAARGLLISAAVTHGPADLDIVVLTTRDRADQWEWVKWLPHNRARGTPLILVNDEQVAGWASAIRSSWQRPSRPTTPSHITLVVLDEPQWWRDRKAPLRPLLSDTSMPLRYIALTDIVEDLPAVCTTVVTERTDGVAAVEDLGERTEIGGVSLYFAELDTAHRCAISLAPLDDPELPAESAGTLPTSVSILRLLDLDELDAVAVRTRWQRAPQPARPIAPLGISARGIVEIDLVNDGPHGLIAGTTGAGKSELLRSLVVGLAATLQPDDINFVLVDFKGGSAFDACADLPHTVGLVTDLDEHLAGRVLRCLQAELHHREVVLRDAGASSLVEYQLLDDVAPLPRLVLVVDEFASVASELPEFLPALVDIAQRGRSLGIHMILATQRPAGVVDNKIKANTNLRIALRVQDDGDSLDVIDTRDAALLPRQKPGRAYARFGAGELTEFQSAYSSGVSSADGTTQLDIHPFVIGRPLTRLEQRLLRNRADADQSGPAASDTDLARLVSSISAASHELGQSHQRRPYPDPLPANIDRTALSARYPGSAIPFGVIDLPDQQRQTPVFWSPGPNGSLAIYGITGAGTSSALVTIALGMAERLSPDAAHLYIIDGDTNLTHPLATLPHTGAVIRLDEPERIARLTRFLNKEIDRRRQLAIELGGPGPVAAREASIVVMIDNIGAVRQTLEDSKEHTDTWPALERALRDGQALGMCAVLTAKTERALPATLAGQIPNRFVMRLGDQFAFAAFGFRPAEIPTFVPGRALRPDDKTELQIARPADDLGATIEALALAPALDNPAVRVDPLPSVVHVQVVARSSAVTERGLDLAVGLDTISGDPAMLQVPFGETAVVVGAGGSGRSTTLAAIATAASVADSSLPIFAVSPRGGALGAFPEADRPSVPSDVADWVERVTTTSGRRLVLIDDADRLGGPSFDKLAACRDDDLIIVFAGRPDDLRQPSHWTKPMQRFRNGVLLRPGALDGEILRVSLGHRPLRFLPHHGIAVSDGEPTHILAAHTGLEPARTS